MKTNKLCRALVSSIHSRQLFHILFLACSLISFHPGPVSAQPDSAENKILVLFDSNTISPWQRSVVQGLENHLFNEQSDFPNIKLGMEFLGVNEVSGGVRPDVTINALKYKQQADPATIIISALPPK